MKQRQQCQCCRWFYMDAWGTSLPTMLCCCVSLCLSDLSALFLCNHIVTLHHLRQCQTCSMEERVIGTCNLPRQVNQSKSQQKLRLQGLSCKSWTKAYEKRSQGDAIGINEAPWQHMQFLARGCKCQDLDLLLQLRWNKSHFGDIWWCKYVKPKKKPGLHSCKQKACCLWMLVEVARASKNKLIKHFRPGLLVRPGRCELKGFATNYDALAVWKRLLRLCQGPSVIWLIMTRHSTAPKNNLDVWTADINVFLQQEW